MSESFKNFLRKQDDEFLLNAYEATDMAMENKTQDERLRLKFQRDLILDVMNERELEPREGNAYSGLLWAAFLSLLLALIIWAAL